MTFVQFEVSDCHKEKRMPMQNSKYKGLISSDWNGCLAPAHPFDAVQFHYPDLMPTLTEVFEKYTSNLISFSEAVGRVQAILPAPITGEQMDAYLDASFKTYSGVPELMEWCRRKDILFMINTTGPQGYFQRIFSKRLLPPTSVLSASTFIRYPGQSTDPPFTYDLTDIQDKPRHTEAILVAEGIPAQKAILIGDSGGDGPHFKWGSEIGACLIGSMTKPSLERYCKREGVEIDRHFGLSYTEGASRNPEEEMHVNFMDLSGTIKEVLEL